jgi:hypothetical protein
MVGSQPGEGADTVTWWDWFNTAAGAASLLGLWVTVAATVLGW